MSKRRRPHGEVKEPVPAYVRLMEHVSGMGYCGSVVDGEPRHVDDYIPPSGVVSADQFVEWLFLAEGLDHRGSSHADETRKAFVTIMGSDVVDASRLAWDANDDCASPMRLRSE